MSRYIDAEKISILCDRFYDGEMNPLVPVRDVVKSIMQTPTEDVASVVHAHWERTRPTSVKSYRRICSACNQVAYMINNEYKYCQNCGARMDGEQK